MGFSWKALAQPQGKSPVVSRASFNLWADGEPHDGYPLCRRLLSAERVSSHCDSNTLRRYDRGDLGASLKGFEVVSIEGVETIYSFYVFNGNRMLGLCVNTY